VIRGGTEPRTIRRGDTHRGTSVAPAVSCGHRQREAEVAGFVQFMEFESSNIDEVEAFARRMQEERGDALLATSATLTEDRERPGTYLVIVEFNSYEDAMANSNDPATDKYAAELVSLLGGATPRFRNLDVRSELLRK